MTTQPALKSPSTARRWPLGLLGALCLAGAAAASDGHDAPPAKGAAKAMPVDEHGAPPAKARPRPLAAAREEAPAAKTPPPPVDPMDRLRERLAEKLGATKAPEAKSPYVVRVTTKDSVADGHGAAHAAPAAPKRKAAPPAAAGHGAAGGHAAHWSYAGEGGPQMWGQLKPEFAKCSTGTRQSPIDIRGGIPVDLEPVQFDYRPSNFGVIDNGHTIQVNLSAGNSIQVMGRRYDLLQFHFHRPSEERINGRLFDMVAHLVHRDPEGRLAVVAVLLERGNVQPLLQTIWSNLPLEKGEEAPARAVIDMNHLLPADRRYFTYMGSLTTPPCSEGVLWMVMQQPVAMAPEQIDVFSRLYPMNARPIQQAAGRLIKQSN